MLKYMRIHPVRVLLILTIALPACKQASQTSYDTQKTLGTYEGSFGKGILSLTINYVNGDVVSGYDIRQGTRRNLNGKLKTDGASLSFTLREPGDRPEDGVFTFRIDTARRGVKGNWTGKGDDRQFRLTRDTGDDRSGGYWVLSVDSVLELKTGGYCEFNYYIHSADSTSQLNTVHGNYAISGNTIRIDWERNAATPSRQMTLHFITRAGEGDAEGDSVRTLEGGGWVLNMPED